MSRLAAAFVQLTGDVGSAGRIYYPLAELNDLLTGAPAAEIEELPLPSLSDPYRLNYVTAMVELAAGVCGASGRRRSAPVERRGATVVHASLHRSFAQSAGAFADCLAATLPAAQHFHRLESWASCLMLTGDRIRKLLEALNQELVGDGVRGKLFLAGGAKGRRTGRFAAGVAQ